MKDQEIINYAKKLRMECLEETQNVETDLTANIIIAKVRDYNRIWNKKAEKNPEMKKDGFCKIMKSFYSDFPDESVKAAAEYL